MSESPFRIRPGIREEWIRYRQNRVVTDPTRLRAGVAGAYLPPVRLPVPHQPQLEIAHSVPQCVAMVLSYFRRPADTAWLAQLLQTDGLHGTSGEKLSWLRAWGVTVDFPRQLQVFRDGTLEVNQRMGTSGARMVFRWEERWLRYLTVSLRAGIPPILFVDLGRLYPVWRGLGQRHAVVLTGGDGRQAWINDPSRREGPTRVGLNTLMDSLLPGEPLAARVSIARAPLLGLDHGPEDDEDVPE